MVSGRHVTLIGPVGSGRTTIGRRVAELLDRRFVDADAELARVTGGRTAPAVERALGLGRLQEIEEEIAIVALTSPQCAVIGPAESVCESEAVRGLLEDAFLVWLDAPAAYLAPSTRHARHRSLAAGRDCADVLAEELRTRRALLGALVDLTVDVSVTPCHEAVAAVVDHCSR